MADGNDNIFTEIGEAARGVAGKAAEGLKNFGSSMAEKTRELATNTKLTNEKESKEKELEANYVKLGKLAYQSGDLTGEMKTVADKIREIYGQLQELELKLNQN